MKAQAYLVTTEPAVEPVSTADLREWSRIDIPDENAIVQAVIRTARRQLERWCASYFVTTGVTALFEMFDDCLDLRGPVQSVSGITYLSENVTTALSASVYQVQTELSRIELAYNQIWPVVDPVGYRGVVVTYVAGYGSTAASVPEEIRTAIKLLAAHYFENRETTSPLTMHEIPYGACNLITEYRRYT